MLATWLSVNPSNDRVMAVFSSSQDLVAHKQRHGISGWLGFRQTKVLHLCKQSPEQGWTFMETGLFCMLRLVSNTCTYSYLNRAVMHPNQGWKGQYDSPTPVEAVCWESRVRKAAVRGRASKQHAACYWSISINIWAIWNHTIQEIGWMESLVADSP